MTFSQSFLMLGMPLPTIGASPVLFCRWHICWSMQRGIDLRAFGCASISDDGSTRRKLSEFSSCFVLFPCSLHQAFVFVAATTKFNFKFCPFPSHIAARWEVKVSF